MADFSARLGYGVDIGGSGIKGAPVDLDAGELAGERTRIPTPSPAEPGAVADVVAEVLASHDWDAGPGAIGCTLPSVVQAGVARTAANIADSWVGLDVADLLTARLGARVVVLNDADAAGHRGDALRGRPRPGRHGGDGDRSAPASAPPSSSTAGWCPTPSSVTWRSTATTRRPRPPTAPASGRTCPGSSSPSG